MTTATFLTAQKFVVTAVNPVTNAVAMETFNDGEYIDWGSVVCNDEAKMNAFIRNLVSQKYPVVVSQTRLNDQGEVEWQVVINIHPKSIDCDCGKGIICPLNKQQVNYFKGQVVTREMETI